MGAAVLVDRSLLHPKALNVTEQLDAGVRYLDLRVAHMLEGSEKNLHFVHMMYTTVLVEVTLGALLDIAECPFHSQVAGPVG